VTVFQISGVLFVLLIHIEGLGLDLPIFLALLGVTETLNVALKLLFVCIDQVGVAVTL
jgi:hypothetical protein